MIIFGKLKLTSLCLIAMMTVFGCSKKFARENSPADNTQLELTPNKVSKNLLITFNNYSEYTSPVIYLRDGETPILANDSQGFPTTGGYDGEPSRTTEYNGISYNSSMQNVDLSKLNVVLADSNQDLFCGNLSFTVQKNNISFKTNSSNVLRSMTNCKFKLTSNYYDLNENKINLQFNYTLKDWMTTLGDSSQAQITANIIEGYCRNIPSHGCSSPIYLLSLSLDNLYITDISPVTSLINLVSLSLKNNAIKNIPSSISELSQLVYLDVRGNSIYNLPDSFSNLLNIKNLLIGYNDFTTFPEPISNLSNLFIRFYYTIY